MIWFITQQICVFLYYWYKAQKSSPPPPSYSLFAHLDGILPEWMLQLTHQYLHYDNWLLKCPKYLFDCCPLAKTMNDDPGILNRLNDLSPVQALSYLFVRRLAEIVAQLVNSWLLIIWTLTLLISIWFSRCSSKQNIDQNTKTILKKRSAIWKLKLTTWLLLFLVPVSFLASCLFDSAFSTSRLQGTTGVPQIFFSSLSQSIAWKTKGHRQNLPKTSDLLKFSSLYQELYGQYKHSGNYETKKLCRLTKVSLSWWSVFISIAINYGIIVISLYAFIWFPMKRVFLRLCSKESSNSGITKSSERSYKEHERNKNTYLDSECLLTAKGDGGASTKKREVVIHPKPESGDGMENRQHNLKYHPPKDAVKPRYVSRGVTARLGQKKNF